MPDLLLELFSEEIPARMQQRAADGLMRLVTDALVEAGLSYEGARAFATPRRLVLSLTGVPARQSDTREERKGPRVSAPEAAIQGFVKSAGLASIDQAKVVSDEKKGDFYLAVIEKPGRAAQSVIAEIIPEMVGKFPWPKSMRWGNGALRWVRPLHSIVCTFGPETEETRIVEFAIDGVRSGNVTYGHRFMAPDAIQVRRFDDYAASLEKAFVVLDAWRRQDMILHDARDLALAHGLELVEDEALLAENAGLVEWPVVLMGAFDEAFLDVPPEVLTTTMKAHQKCFSLRDPKTGKLANRFILVANLKAGDGGKAIVAGNERVIAARLADARFFWQQDLKVLLEDRVEKLKQIVFHEKLGTQYKRIERIERLAGELAPMVGADPEKAGRAARLCKADLVTEMVGEFPELQGLMGKYYAQAQGEDEAVARAIEQHYRPQGPSDAVPSDPVSIAVALADKLYTLVAFWSVNEKPTSSGDPFALRRATLAVIRIALENELRLGLFALFIRARSLYLGARIFGDDAIAADLLAFFRDRLKVYLRDRGARHDLIDAVISPDADDLLMIVRRVEALGKFLDTDDGANLLAGVKRATNILRIEEKKDGRAYDGAPDHKLLAEKAEKDFAKVLDAVAGQVEDHVGGEDFASAMAALAELRPAVDAFFEHVTVNVDDGALRENRLCLLNRLRQATLKVADFSKIEGV